MKSSLIFALLLFFLWNVPAIYADNEPQQATSQQATSQQATSQQATSQQATSQQATSQQATSQQATSQQATSQQAQQNGNISQGEQGQSQQTHTERPAGQVQQRSAPSSPLRSRPFAPSRTGFNRGGPISLNFDDADIYSVIQTVFGEILKVNYVVDQRVKGRVTFRSVAPVAIAQVLPLMETILRIAGVGIVEESGLYRLVPIGDVAKEPAEVMIGRDTDTMSTQGKSVIQVVPISYISSSEIVKLVTPFLTTNAIAIDMPTTNHIILVDTDANIKRILNIINFFDSEQTKKKKPQVFVYHLQNNKARDVAAILQQVFSTPAIGTASSPSTTTVTTSTSTTPGLTAQSVTGAAQQPPRPTAPSLASGLTSLSPPAGAGSSLISNITKIIPDENLNLLIVLALPEDYELIKSAIEKVDIIPRQVVLEGVIAQITLKDDLSLGVSWALQFKSGTFFNRSGAGGFLGFDAPGADIVTTTTTSSTTTTTATATGTGQFTFAGTLGRDAKAVINMLATDSRVKLLAVPHVIVSDNKEARIQVGDQVPIVTSETFGSTTVAPQRTIQYKDIGIILKVKPRINEGGLVSLDIAQEVSSYSIKKITGTDEGIILSKTEATTNLVVQSGQTIIIGGLIREDVTKTRVGIPILSRIPLLGYFFGNTTDNNDRTELIILLTPRVIKNQEDAGSVTSDYIEGITTLGGHLKKDEFLRNKKKNVPRSAPGEKTSGDGADNTGNGDKGVIP
ncbi:MAG: Type II secretion system protein D precursor [Syntrophorhabdus sp. PtaU1.Bin058]|nr:MAG: Type II secretion system protein D precursor [Syntrophorhabdus sp. PtaU1.Bin058]